MAFTLGKKGTKKIPRDPRNQRNVHPNPGGGGGPPSDPSPPLQVRGGDRNTNHGVLPAAAASLASGEGGVGLGGSLAAASVPASAAVLPAAFSTASQGGAGSSSVINLHSPVDADTDEDDAAVAASSYWTTTRNPLLAMEAVAREDGEDIDGEFSDALVQSAIAHRLKRNTSLRDLSFTPQQLEDLLGSLIEN